jgi:hypothetical protein
MALIMPYTNSNIATNNIIRTGDVVKLKTTHLNKINSLK